MACKGEGRVFGEEVVSIDIPAGVQEGMQLSVSGKGNAGERGGPAGDLIILIEEEAASRIATGRVECCFRFAHLIYRCRFWYPGGSANY